MKKILFISCCILCSVCAVMCKKKPKNNATCTSCSGTSVTHPLDSSGVLYFVPTAFTPNGDGENDVFWIIYKNLDTNNSKMTIWDINGTEVFTGKITQHWEGIDLKGVKCPAGQYPVYLEFKTLSGATINTCTCVSILAYTSGCIKTNGVTYYFGDQVNSATPDGFVFPTNETLCP